MSAALVMSAVPILTIFTLFSERFVKGMTAGAIKG
jgi:ABC-type glycerol-3-phosphate transport system permease component